MTTFSFPVLTRAAASSDVSVAANTGIFRSPLNGAVQVLARPGTRLLLGLRYNDLRTNDRALLQGFLAGLYGQEHLVTLAVPGHSQQGALGGSPQVAGAGQTGESLAVDNGPSSQSNWLRAGDMISYSNGSFIELKIVTSDVNTDGGGLATIPISPEIHSSPANNASVDIVVPIIGTWRLSSANGAAWNNKPGVDILSDFAISLEESIV